MENMKYPAKGETQARLKEFLDILLEIDLRTIKRLNEGHKQNQPDKPGIDR